MLGKIINWISFVGRHRLIPLNSESNEPPDIARPTPTLSPTENKLHQGSLSSYSTPIVQAFYRQKSVNLSLIAKECFLTDFSPGTCPLQHIKSPQKSDRGMLTKNKFFRALYCAAWKRGCSFVDSVLRSGRHIVLLYKSRTQSELGTSPRGIDQNVAISRCVRPQLERKVCSTIPTVHERPLNEPPGCLPSLHFGSLRSKKKWSILGWITDRPSHRTGSYKNSEDRWRLDQREGPNGAATSRLAVIDACVCRNKPHHARADGSSV